MKGYYASIGRNKAASFNYFPDFKTALEWVLNSLNFEKTQLNMNEFDMTIKEMELKVCTCKNLIPFEQFECLKCEDIKHDAYLESKEQKEAVYPEKEVD